MTAVLTESLTQPASARASRASVVSAALFFGALWFVLGRHLSSEWSINEQYNYGWFVPFFAAYLFWLRWEDRPPPGGGSSKLQAPSSKLKNVLLSLAFLLLAALLPLRLFEVGNPDWRPLGWLHAVIVVGLTLLLIWRVGGPTWVRHFAFPVCFIFVAVPWVSPIESPIIQGLMRMVAAIAAETLNLLGVPAQLEGNLIRTSSGLVGVNEACSGVRSLQTSIMIGLLFGELKRFDLARRLVLLGGAIVFAFIANCGRAIFLAWIAANDGTTAGNRWHDVAGYTIVVVVFAGTVLLAALLARKKSDVGNQKSEINRLPISDFRLLRSAFRIPHSAFVAALTWMVVVELAVEAWYRAHERKLVATETWSVRWPEDAPGFEEIKIDQDVAATLRYSHGREGRWRIAFPDQAGSRASAAAAATCSMFFFRWEPGATSILRARAHRPDVCLPNTGWQLAHDHGVRLYSVAGGREMPFRHFTFVRPPAERRELQADAFFCQQEDRIRAGGDRQSNFTAVPLSDWSQADRIRVVREGVRNQGQQVLQLIFMTPKPLERAQIEAEFAKLVRDLVQIDG